ncbi:MAG: tRNA (adenosine(37)-N6)-dimethylallyltransferase MiaA [Verrucomicrobiota bacterium]
MMPTPPATLFLAGPTAVGKSAVALCLAERLGGEIISVDSMQVYRGLDIGTAKPSAADRARVPHHLLDVAELTEPFDASRFVALATDAVSAIHARGKWAIFCGGTGLYFRAWIEGLGHAPTDPQLRAALEAMPLPELLEELAAKDPVTFERIDRQNPRRVWRAIEVIRLTGQPFSAQRATWTKSAAEAQRLRFYGLQRTTEELHTRIHARVEDMFALGLVAETQALMQRGIEQNRNAMQAIGYRQVVEYLRGERDLKATIELVKARTRQYARRQMTWFRRQAPVQWIEWQPGQSAEMIAATILVAADSNELECDLE